MKGDERQERPSVAEPGWYHGVRQAFVPDLWDGGFCVFRAGENDFLLRSRFAQRLDVRGNVRLAVSLAVALQKTHFDQP
jgi:hypothetical protein